MSKSDDKTGYYSGRGNGPGFDPQRPSGFVRDPLELRQRPLLQVDPKRQNQGEYPHVGGQRTTNQQFPASGNSQGQYSNQSARGLSGTQQGYSGYDDADTGQYAQPQNTGYYAQPPRSLAGPQRAQTSFNHPGYDANSGTNSQYSSYSGPQSSYASSGLNSGLQPPSRASLFDDTDMPPLAGSGYAGGYNPQDYGNQGRYAYPQAQGGSYGGPGNSYEAAYAQGRYNQYGSEDYYSSDGQDSEYYEDGYDDEQYEVEKPKKGRFALVMTVLFTVVTVGGVTAFAYKKEWIGKGGNQMASGKPPVISADKDPIKAKPTDPGGKAIGNTEKQIYDRLAGKPANGAEGERLVSRQEPENITTASTAGQTKTRGFNASDNNNQSKEGQEQGQNEQVITMTGNTGGGEAETSSGSGEAVGPKSVKTFLVRPDGTMMSSSPTKSEQQTALLTQPQETQQGEANQVQEESKVPVVDIPERGSVTSSGSGDNNTVSVGEAVSQNSQTEGNQADGQKEQQVSSLVVKNEDNVEKPKTRAFNANAEQSQENDAQKNVKEARLETQDAAKQETSGSQASIAPGKFAIQIASHQDHTVALETFANLQQKHPGLIGSYGPVIQKADLGAKGIWYRLLIGPMDNKSNATELCSKLKSAGVSGCMVKSM